jgi:hypothetical protein
MWTLASGLNVEGGSILTSGAYTVESNTWYNLSMSVIGTTVNAWVGTDQVRWLTDVPSCCHMTAQVVNGYTLSSIAAGWAAIGTSVQANNVFTYAQFDNFQVYGNRLQCPVPFAGNTISTNVWCGCMWPFDVMMLFSSYVQRLTARAQSGFSTRARSS